MLLLAILCRMFVSETYPNFSNVNLKKVNNQIVFPKNFLRVYFGPKTVCVFSKKLKSNNYESA